MAVGDVRGNLERVRTQLRSIGYPDGAVDVQGLRDGMPAALLPALHHALLGYSRPVARFLSRSGYELFAKSDLRFMEAVLRLLRREFHYRCALTLTQFFSHGYAERKLLLLYDIIHLSKQKHAELAGAGVIAAHKSAPERPTRRTA